MAVSIIRKRSPRAPLSSLRQAVDRVAKVYEKEGRHAASADIVAQHLGYKSADNGAAKQAIAALGYYGLLERQKEGMLAVAKNFEEFKFAPDEKIRLAILETWLSTPPVFEELLGKFQGRLPSEASLKYELIQKEFSPATAAECVAAFLDSVQYVSSAKELVSSNVNTVDVAANKEEGEVLAQSVGHVKSDSNIYDTSSMHSESKTRTAVPAREIVEEESSDRIPVRLANGRRAWLVIPTPFYAADKRRLISQIEFLLADDEE